MNMSEHVKTDWYIIEGFGVYGIFFFRPLVRIIDRIFQICANGQKLPVKTNAICRSYNCTNLPQQELRVTATTVNCTNIYQFTIAYLITTGLSGIK